MHYSMQTDYANVRVMQPMIDGLALLAIDKFVKN